MVGKGDYIINNSFGYTPRVKKILEVSAAISRQLGNNYVGTEHMLYAIMTESDSVAVRILRELSGRFCKA